MRIGGRDLPLTVCRRSAAWCGLTRLCIGPQTFGRVLRLIYRQRKSCYDKTSDIECWSFEFNSQHNGGLGLNLRGGLPPL
jgi:hypothetical protein